MGYQDLEAIRRLTEDQATRLRQMVDEALRPMDGLMAFERQMAARFREVQASFQFPWERMLAEFERSLPTFQLPDLRGLLPVVPEPVCQPAPDLPSLPPVVPHVSVLEDLAALVERLEDLLPPPSPPDEGDDPRPMPGQYL